MTAMAVVKRFPGIGTVFSFLFCQVVDLMVTTSSLTGILPEITDKPIP
jgi:hypothetical protein